LLIASMRAYGAGVDEAGHITDVFLHTVNQGLTTLPELASSMGRILPTASSLGISLDEVGFTMGKLTQAGLSTDEAATRFNATLTALMKPTTELQDAIESLGYQTGSEFVQQSGGALGALRQLKDAGFLDTTAEVSSLFGNVRALGGVLALMSDDATLAEGAVEAFGEAAGGAVERAREQQYKSLSAQLAKLKSAFEAMAIKIGTAVLPPLITLVDTILVPMAQQLGQNLGPALERISELARQFGDAFVFLIERIQDVGLAEVFTVFEDGSSILSSFLEKLGFGESAAQNIASAIVDLKDRIVEFVSPILDFIKNFVSAKDVLIALGIAIASFVIPAIIAVIGALAPLVLTAAALIGLVALVRNAWENNWGGIRDKVQEVIPAIRDFIVNAVTRIREFVGQALQAIREFWDEHGEQILTTVRTAFITAQRIIRTVVGRIRDFIKSALEKIRAFWDDNGKNIMSGVKRAFEAIKTIIMRIVSTIAPVIQRFVQNAGKHFEAFKPVIERIKTLFESLKPVLAIVGGAFVALIGIVTSVVAAVINALGPFIEGIAGVLDGLIQVITGVIDTVVGFVQLLIGLFTGNTEAVTAAWQKMKDGIGEIVGGLVDTVVNLFTGLWETVVALVEGFVDAIVGFFQGLFDQLVGGSIVVEMVESIIDWFKNLVTTVVQAIADFVVNLINKFNELVTTVLAAIADFVVNLITNFKKMTIDILVAIGQFVIDMLVKWNELISDVISAVAQFVIDIIENFGEMISDVLDAIGTFVIDTITKFGEMATGVLDALRQLALDFLTKLHEFIVDVLAAIGQFVLDIVSKFTSMDWAQVGSDLIHGIGNGISSAISWLAGRARAAAESAFNAALNFFESRSPSKKGIYLGESFSIGIAKGIDDSISEIADVAEAAAAQALGSWGNFIQTAIPRELVSGLLVGPGGEFVSRGIAAGLSPLPIGGQEVTNNWNVNIVGVEGVENLPSVELMMALGVDV
jgi:phage-related protein